MATTFEAKKLCLSLGQLWNTIHDLFDGDLFLADAPSPGVSDGVSDRQPANGCQEEHPFVHAYVRCSVEMHNYS